MQLAMLICITKRDSMKFQGYGPHVAIVSRIADGNILTLLSHGNLFDLLGNFPFIL